MNPAFNRPALISITANTFWFSSFSPLGAAPAMFACRCFASRLLLRTNPNSRPYEKSPQHAEKWWSRKPVSESGYAFQDYGRETGALVLVSV
jgi:hypothetical protein